MERNDAGLAWEVLSRYTDPATAEFDAVLTTAALPDDVARVLRFWQREAVANVKQYAAEAIPAVLAAIASAQADAAASTARAAAVLTAGRSARTPGTDPWTAPVETPRTITLPDGEADAPESSALLEERRRAVAARLSQLG